MKKSTHFGASIFWLKTFLKVSEELLLHIAYSAFAWYNSAILWKEREAT
jgi:hypothetical protein